MFNPGIIPIPKSRDSGKIFSPEIQILEEALFKKQSIAFFIIMTQIYLVDISIAHRWKADKNIFPTLCNIFFYGKLSDHNDEKYLLGLSRNLSQSSLS